MEYISTRQLFPLTPVNDHAKLDVISLQGVIPVTVKRLHKDAFEAYARGRRILQEPLLDSKMAAEALEHYGESHAISRNMCAMFLQHMLETRRNPERSSISLHWYRRSVRKIDTLHGLAICELKKDRAILIDYLCSIETPDRRERVLHDFMQAPLAQLRESRVDSPYPFGQLPNITNTVQKQRRAACTDFYNAGKRRYRWPRGYAESFCAVLQGYHCDEDMMLLDLVPSWLDDAFARHVLGQGACDLEKSPRNTLLLHENIVYALENGIVAIVAVENDKWNEDDVLYQLILLDREFECRDFHPEYKRGEAMVKENSVESQTAERPYWGELHRRRLEFRGRARPFKHLIFFRFLMTALAAHERKGRMSLIDVLDLWPCKKPLLSRTFISNIATILGEDRMLHSLQTACFDHGSSSDDEMLSLGRSCLDRTEEFLLMARYSQYRYLDWAQDHEHRVDVVHHELRAGDEDREKFGADSGSRFHWKPYIHKGYFDATRSTYAVPDLGPAHNIEACHVSLGYFDPHLDDFDSDDTDSDDS